MSELVLSGIAKTYDGNDPALKPLDLHVRSGELVVLVGPSGCGKSTLLKIVAGLEAPTGGTVTLGGRDITHAEPRRRGIAMVFQNYALYPHLSVAENLAYPLRRAGFARAAIAERVAATARQLHLSELLDRRPAQLSGGQKQRVAMGRAIIREPDLFLLDEPLSNLDSGLRAHVRGEIREVQNRLRTTMLYVTHDQIEAQTLADRIVVMRQGAVQQVGSPREIFARPANLFVASILGAPQINIVPATISAPDGRILVAGAALQLKDAARRLARLPPGATPGFLGVRPEALADAGDSTRDDPCLMLRGTAIRREFFGGAQLVCFRSDDPAPLPAQLPSLSGRDNLDELFWLTDDRPIGARVSVRASMDDVLLYDATGRLIE